LHALKNEFEGISDYCWGEKQNKIELLKTMKFNEIVFQVLLFESAKSQETTREFDDLNFCVLKTFMISYVQNAQQTCKCLPRSDSLWDLIDFGWVK
jgi:hypothetical protein